MSDMSSVGREMMSDSKFFMGYSRWKDDTNEYETWDESVERVMNMHRQKYANIMTDELEYNIKFAESAYKNMEVLGAQRALQFGGEQIFKHEARMYNCSSSYIDRTRFFSEAFYVSLCGAGVGFSVQRHHIDKLPAVARRSLKKVKVYSIPDDIEGWSDAVGVLLSSYFVTGSMFPEYMGCQVHFDYSKIRPKGSLISGGFKAPGPDGLRIALQRIEDLIESYLKDGSPKKLNSITAYDIMMHIADAVISGGVRRAATICVFDKDDELMLKAKTGKWFVENPQRARSNNSAILIRDELSRPEWANIMTNVKQYGEPGFIFASSKEHIFNPCVTGDTLVTVCDHGMIKDGDLISTGQVYQVPMKMLVELYETSDLPPMIVSYDTETGKIEFDILDAAALTRKNADVIELELEDGSTLKLTPDHKVWTETRGWVEAKDLLPTDVLLKI